MKLHSKNQFDLQCVIHTPNDLNKWESKRMQTELLSVKYLLYSRQFYVWLISVFYVLKLCD